MRKFLYAGSVGRRLMFFYAPDTGANGGGEGAAAVAELLPGAEMLVRGKGNGSTAEDFEASKTGGLPEAWTPDNASADDEDEVGVGASTETPGGAEAEDGGTEGQGDAGAASATAADARKDWPEAARTAVATAETELASLRTEVETLKSAAPVPAPAPTAENPLAEVTKEENLASHIGFATQVKSWARKHLGSGGELPAEIQALMEGRKASEITEPRVLSAEETADLLGASEEMLEKHVPARREFLKQEREADSFLRENWPQYLDPKTEEGKLFVSFEQQFPQVKNLPRWKTVLASAVRGHLELEKEFKAKAAAKASGANGNLHKTATGGPIAPVPPQNRGGAGPKSAAGGAAPRAPGKSKLRVGMDAEELASSGALG